jgi:hypothetical protein
MYINKGSEMKMIKFKTYKYIDQVFRCEAFSMLIPEGWIPSGGIIWRQHPTMPGAVQFSVTSPDGLDELSLLPTMPYFWSGGMMNMFTFPEGSYYLGNEVRRPVANHLQYIQQYILPKREVNIRIVGDSRNAELENAMRMENQGGFGFNVNADAGTAKLEYGRRGHFFEENITCGILNVNMMYGQTNWIADKMISTRSLRGQLSEKDKIFSVMLKSFKFDIYWFNFYCQYVQALSQSAMNSINAAGEISRIIAENNRHISDIIRRSYDNQQATYDRVYRGISESIRGVNSYYDPYKGYSVQVPNSYRYVYANGLGEYYMTDNPNDNPNTRSNLNWTNLNRG